MTYGAKKKNPIHIQLAMVKYDPEINIFFCNNIVENKGELIF